jgi:serine phosphatase RsbU (regulator of sigma subunit)
VGGDWYIIPDMPGGHVLIAIGDVASHGLAAPPPVLSGWARAMRPPAGILLGAGRQEYAAATLALVAGDLLFLYSDGLIERRDRPVDAGVAELSAAVPGIADPERAIAAALPALGLTDVEDDTCLVALRML